MSCVTIIDQSFNNIEVIPLNEYNGINENKTYFPKSLECTFIEILMRFVE